MSRTRLLTTIALAGIASGCVKITAQKHKYGDAAADVQGIPFYTSLPHLLVTEPIVISSAIVESATVGAAGNGASKDPPGEEDQSDDTEEEESSSTEGDSESEGSVQIVYLPDYCQQYHLKTRVVLAKLNFEPEFQDGWQLKSLGEVDADASSVAEGVISALTDIATAALGGSSDSDESSEENTDGEDQSASTTKTKIETVLPPGLYPLYERSTSDDGMCDAPPTPTSPTAFSQHFAVYENGKARE